MASNKRVRGIPWASLCIYAVICAGGYAAYNHVDDLLAYLNARGSAVVSIAATDLAGADRSVGSDAEPASLADKERKFLWDVEHEAFLLVNKVFPGLATRVHENDRSGVSDHFHSEVKGRLPSPDSWTVRDTGFAILRWQSQSNLLPAGHTDVIDQLWKLRNEIADLHGVKWKLMQLSPVDRSQFDGPWKGTSKIRMWGDTEKSQRIEVVLKTGFTLPTKPDQGTKAVPKFVEWSVETVRVARSMDTSDLSLRENAAARGVDVDRFYDNWQHPDAVPSLVTGGLYVCDYDLDGWLDVLITDLNTA